MVHKTLPSKLVNIFVCLCLILFSLIIWFPFRFEPYHWDSAGFVNVAADRLVQTKFSPLLAIGSDFAHPPLIPLLLGLVKSSISHTLLASHLLMLPFLPILLISTYFLGQKLSSRLVGLGAAFLVGFTPVVLAEYGIIYLDLPVAALGLLTLCLWVNRHLFWSLVAFSLALLTKETALLVLPFLIVYPFKDISLKQKIIYLAFPLVVLGLWFTYHHTITGWWLASPNAQLGHRFLQSIEELVVVVQKVFQITFIDQYRWLIALPLFGSLLYLLKNRRILPRPLDRTLLSLSASIGFFLLFYFIASEYAPRYALIILPLVYLYTLMTLFWYLNQVKPQWSQLVLSIYVLFVCLVFSFSWRPKVANLDTYDFRPPSDLRFQDMSRIFREASGFVTATFPNTPVFGSFPESLYLTDPSAGFVTNPVVFSECVRFDPQATSTAVFFVHPFSPGQLACKRWVETLNLKPVKSFSSADKWLELYQYTATPSSVISGQAT